MDKLPVVEIFGPTLQGEGSLVGVRSMFVRLGYCDGAVGGKSWCSWCDSMHAVDPARSHEWSRMDADEIVSELRRLSKTCGLVTLSGGNPALYDLTELMHVLDLYSYSTAIETQGTFWRPWMSNLDYIVVSPKPPSSGAPASLVRPQFIDWVERMSDDCNEPNRHNRIPTLSVKIPVANMSDYAFAKRMWDIALGGTSEYQAVDCCLSVVTRPNDTAETILERWRFWAGVVLRDSDLSVGVRVIPQTHVMLWGHKLGV